MGMDAYSAFLTHQRTAMAAAGTTIAPPKGCISHAMAVEKYHRMLSELVVRGNYYITPPQLERILKWATVDSATPADSKSSWRLLMLMVHSSRKEIEPNAASAFLLESLCAVKPQYMTWSGWQCLTLYMAAVSNWNIDMKNREGYEEIDLANEVVLSSESQWQAWRSVLVSTALHAEDRPASRASVLLSRLVAHDAQIVFHGEAYATLLQTELSTWQNELETAVRTLCGRLPESGWHDAPPCFATASSSCESMQQAAKTAKRALLYLQQVIECGQAKSLPVKFSHAASYRDSTAVIDFQLPGVHATSQIAQKLTISLPKNSYVGVLRSVAAEKVSTAFGRNISPAVLRMLSGGKECAEDGVIMTRADGLLPTVLLAYAPQPNPAWHLSTLSQPAREQLISAASETSAAAAAVVAAAVASPISASDALVAAAEENPNCNIYSLALTMEQIHLPKECDQEGELGHLLRSAAKGLLNALPTCSRALDDVQNLLLSNTTPAESRASLLRIISSSNGTFMPNVSISKSAVMRYLAEALCVLILPAHNPLVSDDVTADREERAAALHSRLFVSNVMPTLLEVAALVPATQMVSAAADFQLHVAMILLANSVSEDILNRKNFSLENAEEQQEQAGGPETSTTCTAEVEGDTRAVQCIAEYAVAMMHSALAKEGNRLQLPTGGDGSGGGGATTCPPCPPSALTTSAEGALLMAHYSDELCYKGLNLLKTCIDAVPTLATVLVSPPSLEEEGEEAAKEQKNSLNADRLSSIILTLLYHSKQRMRSTVTSWIHHFVAASAEARSWTFSNIITPLLLSIDSNDEQTFLISQFLSNLNAEEVVVAEGVLLQLVDRFVEAVEGGDIGAVKATVENILILIKKLDCHSVAEVRKG
jgi:hypothetical protein